MLTAKFVMINKHSTVQCGTIILKVIIIMNNEL